HPTRGPIEPSTFIALDEGAGLIGAIDRLMIDRSLQELAVWRRSAPSLRVQVNVSGRSIGPDLTGRVAAAIAAAGVPASGLTIEVTESWLIRNEHEVAVILGALADIGTQIHLDDFGTGYSSLAHIHALPITGLKVDRSFVSRSAGSERSRRLIAATIGMARSLELEVVAEGVETEDVAEMLAELGCELGQGFLFARPSPPADITALLAESIAAAGPVDNS
ncbi:MAG: EAL domain-containing protein, partial [Actinomycetota bacterium]